MNGETTRYPNSKQIEALLTYLPLFDSPGYRPGAWIAEEGKMPWYSYKPEVLAFANCAASEGFMIVFDWPKWADEAKHYVDDPAALADADLSTLRKLLTLHIRADRFNEGHLAAMFENGHIVGILRRLQCLRQEM